MGNGAASAMVWTPHPEMPDNVSYFAWQPPTKSVSVRILPELLSEIARRSAKGCPEGGGLLLGSVRYAGAYTVTIESIEGIEGRFWRGFQQPHENAGRRRLELALARWRPGADRPLAAVGYYRTEAGEAALGPSRDDLMLIARYFSAPHNVFLFVRPARDDAAATGGLVCWQFGQIPETPDEEFSLEAPPFTLVTAQPPALQAPAQAVSVPPPGAPAVIAVRRLWVIAALAALLLLAAAAVGLFLMRGMPVRQAAPSTRVAVSPLALTADRSGTDYHVTWDRNAPAVLFASRGLLTITDSGSVRVIDLDLAQLKNGSLLYTPVSGDVLIQLEVIGSGPAATESVRVLGPGPARDGVQPAPLVVKPVPSTAVPVENTKAARVPAQPPPLVATRAFTAPAVSSSAAVPTPPEMAAAASVSSAPVVSVPSEPPPAEPQSQERTPATPAAPQRVSDYRPPRPIDQPRPAMNQFARQALVGAGNSVIQVDVEITVDKTGRVSAIKPFTGSDAVRRTLWSVAADAVRRWKFEPARLNDQVVEGPMTLSFRFGGSGSK